MLNLSRLKLLALFIALLLLYTCIKTMVVKNPFLRKMDNGVQSVPEHSSVSMAASGRKVFVGNVTLLSTTELPDEIVYKSQRIVPKLKLPNVDEQLDIYERQCDETWFPRNNNSLPRCPCIPETLEGPTLSGFNVYSWRLMTDKNPTVSEGGMWTPTKCLPREKIAIIIPLMNRHHHLRVLLSVLHPFLQRQQISYRIYVAEQVTPKVFNKGNIMNAAFAEITRMNTFDCIIFHDVDMLPEDDRNLYQCSLGSPLHAGAYIDKYNYTMSGGVTVGGVIGFSPDHYVRVNGYSNLYYGWGGEDDDMAQRIRHEKLLVRRHSSSVARYTMIEHDRDDSNPINPYRHATLDRIINNGKKIYKKDGLNNARYEIVSLVRENMFTYIKLSIPKQSLSVT